MTTTPDLQLPLRAAIDIREQVHADDFVLQLHRGVSAAQQTLDEYVVTDAIASSFDEALGIVQSAVLGSSSKGAFIHGSFGSGKSHFMAVLHLLLTGSVMARELKGLQAVVAKYDAVLGKNYLAVDYHLLGKKSFEEALFAGYLAQIREAHPDAPLPVLHNSDAIIRDAENLRAAMGDEPFLAKLTTGDGGTSKWGKRASSSYTLDTYLHAIAQPADSSDRQRVVRALVANYFGASVASGEWLEISQGLRAMTEHAKELRYDGIVLFLDELVLWLGQHLGDLSFIQTETSKVAKLVESEMGQLPVPLISFVARQRDLKDFLGGSAVGAEQVSLGQSFQWWEDRFDKLDLKAADLPQIVQKRLLTPSSVLGAVSLAAAVAQVKANPAAWKYLLDDEAGSGEVDFTRVYPFSPALVDAMIALSSLMQRERTALKLMSELLSQGRSELVVRDVIPVGDLFDAVVLGDAKPLTDDMKTRFANARDFYERKMRPYLLGQHSLTEAQAAALPRSHAFRTEDRLAKTLLVAEIAPGAVSLKNLTASKLAALNFGTVVSFIPGAEATQVLGWVRNWAKEFGEVNVGAGPDPLISIQLTGVDYDSVLDRVRVEDTSNARRRLIRDLLLDEFGVKQPGGLVTDVQHTHVWRGTKHTADLVFGNIRDESALSDQALVATGGRWKVAIDYPFDDSGEHGPQDDVIRMHATLHERGLESTTIAWAPHHLSQSRMDDVGKLVLLEYVLGGRFDANSDHLPLADREPARIQLDNQRNNLTEQVRIALRQAYNVIKGVEGNLGREVNVGDTFTSLVPGFQPRTPQATSLLGGLNDVLGQALDQQYPDHPRFDPSNVEVTKSQLTWTLDLARQAASAGGRVESIDRARATQVRKVTSALRLGEMHENHYVLNPTNFGWLKDFTQWASAAGDDVNVAALRTRLEPYGMPREMQDLLILAWAALADRQFVRYNADAGQPGLGALTDDTSLRAAVLPDETLWRAAVERGSTVFGIPAEHYRNTASVRRLAGAVGTKAKELAPGARALATALTEHARTLGLDGPPAARLDTARRGQELVDLLARTTEPTELVERFASFDLPAEPQALARSLASAHVVAAMLDGAQWALLDQLGTFDDDRDATIRDALQGAARAEELHQQLAPALAAATSAIIAMLRVPDPKRGGGSGGGPEGETTGSSGGGAGGGVVGGGDRVVVDPDDVELVIDGEFSWATVEATLRDAFAKRVPGKRFKVTGRWV